MSSSYTSSSTSYSSTTINGETKSTGQQSVERAETDASGNTTVKSTTQVLGEPPVEETKTYDSSGRQLEGSNDGSKRIEDVTQDENDRKYEEAMEDEYAKREGGA